MDEYQCYEATQRDYADLAEQLTDNGSIVFSYSPDRITAYVIILTYKFKKLGILPFGGNPNNCVLVSVLKHGTFWFSPFQGKEPSYVGEKLGLTGFDAQAITDLLNGIFTMLNPLRSPY